jgi:anti-anti-sigma factor
MLDIEVVTCADTTRVRLSGALDGEGSLLLRQALKRLHAAETGPVVFDLAAVSYLTSAGLRVLLEARCERDQDRLVLCRPQPVVQSLLQLSGLAGLLTIHPDTPSAVQGRVAQRRLDIRPGHEPLHADG